MKLKTFQITSFRSIVDSTTVDVDSEVTCLVGKNESGKTAILEALFRLNPVREARFDLDAEYPRWLIVKDKRAGTAAEAIPITATFELDINDLQAVENEVGEDVLLGTTLTVSMGYDNISRYDFEVDELKAVANLVERVGVSHVTMERVGNVETLAHLSPAVSAAQAGVTADDEDVEVLTKELADLMAALAGATDTGWQIVAGILQGRVPRFFYFSQYQTLDGRIDLRALAASTDPGSTPDQTARALLALALTTPEELSGDGYEQRKSTLEAVSNDLSEQVFEYWTQNPNLKARFDVDRVVENPNSAAPSIHSYLEVRVEDTRHQFTNNFSQRSSGFQWFFSFFAAFSEFENQNQDGKVIVLLDEPGLSLHGKAQGDFLRFINDRLAPNVQVIYTTHSPFMVETARMARVRIVEDKGPKEGSVVSSDAMVVGDDSLFPIQAALGYDIAQNLFIGDTNLLVEGPSDYLYLDTISRYLGSVERTSLDERCRILPAGGSSNIPAFVTLLGRELSVTVLVDSGTEGLGRLQNAMTAGRLKTNRLISVGEITDSKHADIEDLFTEKDYLKLYNQAFGTKLKPNQLGHGERITHRIEEADKKFDHYKPAQVLLRDQVTLLPDLNEVTLDNFEKLIIRINATFG